MINIKDEADKWSADVSGVGASSIEMVISAWQHWIQIKHLEKMEKSVLGWAPVDSEFDAKMRGVVEFLSDLQKKIWHKQ